MNEVNKNESATANQIHSNNNILVIILLLVVIILIGYIVYDKFIKKDTNEIVPNNEITTEQTNSTEENTSREDTVPAMSDEEALNLGNSTYDKLQKFINSFKKEEEKAIKDNKTELCLNEDGNHLCNDGVIYVKHNNFLEEFKSLFTTNIQVNDVFVQYDIETKDYICNFKKCSGSSTNLGYIVKDNEYYFDSECRGSGCEAGSLTDFKLDKNEGNKLVFTYKIIKKKSIGNGMCDWETEKEYNDYVKDATTYQLELIKENNDWKINKAAVTGKCNNNLIINQ